MQNNLNENQFYGSDHNYDKEITKRVLSRDFGGSLYSLKGCEEM